MLIIDDYEVLGLNPKLIALIRVVEGVIGHPVITRLGEMVFDSIREVWCRNTIHIKVSHKEVAYSLKTYIDQHFCYDRTESDSSCFIIWFSHTETIVKLQVSFLTVKKVFGGIL